MFVHSLDNCPRYQLDVVTRLHLNLGDLILQTKFVVHRCKVINIIACTVIANFPVPGVLTPCTVVHEPLKQTLHVHEY